MQEIIRFPLPAGNVALLHPDRRRLFVFNRTSHLLWRVLVRRGRSCLPVVLTSRLGLAPSDATRDADAIWKQWQELGIIDGPNQPNEPALPIDQPPFRESTLRSRIRIGPLLVDVRAPPDIAGLLFPIWEHRRDESASPNVACLFEIAEDGRGRLTIDGRPVLDKVKPHVLAGAFCQAVLERLHPTNSFCAVMHAGAVSAGRNSMIIAAPSGSGKSTLTAYLVARGYTYLSDDFAPLRTQDHAVVPFPLPISVKPGAASALKPFYPGLQADGAQPQQFLPQDVDFLAPPRHATVLLFPRYREGASIRFEEIGVTEALSHLLADRIFFGYPIPPEMVASFLAWLRRVKRRVLVYSDFAEAERCIASVLRA